MIAQAGTTSNAYSSRPRKNPGPCGAVNTSPYRNPKFHTPVPDWLPLIPCPPPVQICHSLAASFKSTCAAAFAGPIPATNASATTTHHRFTVLPQKSQPEHHIRIQPTRQSHTTASAKRQRRATSWPGASIRRAPSATRTCEYQDQRARETIETTNHFLEPSSLASIQFLLSIQRKNFLCEKMHCCSESGSWLL